MGMAVAVSMRQDNFRARYWRSDAEWRWNATLDPIPDIGVNTNFSWDADNFRLEFLVTQLNGSISPSQYVYYYPFYSLNGGSYSPIYMDGKSSAANNSPIVTIPPTDTEWGGADNLSYLNGGTSNFAYNPAPHNEASEVLHAVERVFWEGAETAPFGLLNLFRINYDVANENDVIRVRMYRTIAYTGSTARVTTVSAMEAAIASGDIIAFDAGYTNTPEITVLANVVTGTLAAQEFRRDIFAGIETFPEVFNQIATNVGTNTIELTWDTIGVPDYGEGS